MGKHSPPNPELDEKISLLYQLGNSTYQIARKLDLKATYVESSLIRTNTPRRSISEAKKLRRVMA